MFPPPELLEDELELLEDELLEELAIDLETHDEFVRLVKSVIELEQYRRVR